MANKPVFKIACDLRESQYMLASYFVIPMEQETLIQFWDNGEDFRSELIDRELHEKLYDIAWNCDQFDAPVFYMCTGESGCENFESPQEAHEYIDSIEEQASHYTHWRALILASSTRTPKGEENGSSSNN